MTTRKTRCRYRRRRKKDEMISYSERNLLRRLRKVEGIVDDDVLEQIEAENRNIELRGLPCPCPYCAEKEAEICDAIIDQIIKECDQAARITQLAQSRSEILWCLGRLNSSYGSKPFK